MNPEEHIGEKLGPYVLERLLGAGGMGAVYQARHSLLGRKAAIKLLSGSLAHDASFVSRFFHEARIVNEVHHPNIVDVVDFIQTESPRRVAYVMELIQGPALSSALGQRRFTVLQTLNVSLQIARALEAVHRIGVVHRDLKPANVLLPAGLDSAFDQVGQVKVLDFGIAKVSDPDAGHRTATGAMLGTPQYMAPEQVAGDPVSPATDVYALGEILAEMASGVRVFQGDQLTILRAKLDPTRAAPIPDLSGVEEGQAIERLCRVCLESVPASRPTLSEVSAELEEIRGRLGRTVRPVARAEAPPARPFVEPQTMAGHSLAIAPPPERRVLVFGVIGALAAAGAFAGWLFARDDGPEVLVSRALPDHPAVVEALPAPAPSAAVVAPVPAPAPAPATEVAPPAPAPEPRRSVAPKPGTKPRVTPPPAVPPPPVEPPPVVTPPEPKPEPVPETGRLYVEVWTTGGRSLPAVVLIDGREVKGRTPLDLRARAGKRTVEVRAPGYPPRQRVIDVPAGREAKLSIVADLE